MSTPLWVMLAFAAWTHAVLVGSIGVYRLSRVFTGHATMAEWRADGMQGDPWYQRATRAHMNCVENLPVYSAVALAAAVTGVGGAALDALALIFIAARIGQTLVHITRAQTERVVNVRFGLFSMQIACIVSMGVLVAVGA
jgi:uncharacterized MAPEG superfamily protein